MIKSATQPALFQFRFRPDLVGNAELAQQAIEIDAARSAARRVDIGNGLCRQQCALEGLDRADVRLGRAVLHHHAHADPREIDRRARDLALCRQLGKRARRGYDDIEGLAAFDPLLQGADRVVVDDQLVTLFLELRHHRQHHLLHRAGGQDLELRGGGTFREHREKREQRGA